MNIIRYSIRSFFANEYYSIIRFTSKRLFVATLHIIHEIHGIEEYLQQPYAQPEAQGAPEVSAEVSEGQGRVERLRHFDSLVK